MARVVIGLSGGVDSSVAAWLLKQQGHEVIGLFMINWHDTTGTLEGDCPWHDDRVFAELVAKKLDIALHVADLSDEYRARVVEYMFAEYEQGRTPNPDVLCNREIKFGAMWDAAQALGAAEPAALIERNRAIAEAFTVGKDTAPHIRRYYDDLTEQTAKELVV